MADLAVSQNVKTVGERRQFQWVLLSLAALITVGVSFFLGHYFGYRSGYQAAYVPEHSHFVFEQKRARGLQKRITDQRRCIDQRVRAIPSIDAGGFVGLGELFRNVGLLYASTRLCDDASGLGVPSQSELKRIFPSSSD